MEMAWSFQHTYTSTYNPIYNVSPYNGFATYATLGAQYRTQAHAGITNKVDCDVYIWAITSGDYTHGTSQSFNTPGYTGDYRNIRWCSAQSTRGGDNEFLFMFVVETSTGLIYPVVYEENSWQGRCEKHTNSISYKYNELPSEVKRAFFESYNAEDSLGSSYIFEISGTYDRLLNVATKTSLNTARDAIEFNYSNNYSQGISNYQSVKTILSNIRS